MTETEVKKRINDLTIYKKWEQFVSDNLTKIRREVFNQTNDVKYINAFNYATDLFFDELSQGYDSQMLAKRFEKTVYNNDWFFNELFMLLDYYTE